jgi:hypothetical protein
MWAKCIGENFMSKNAKRNLKISIFEIMRVASSGMRKRQ